MPNPQPDEPNVHWTTAPDGSQMSFVWNGKKWEHLSTIPPQPQVQYSPPAGSNTAGYNMQPDTNRYVQAKVPQPRKWGSWLLGGCLTLGIIAAIIIMIGLALMSDLPRMAGSFFQGVFGNQELIVDPIGNGGFSTVCSNPRVYAPGWNNAGQAFVANGESDGNFEYVYLDRRGGVNVGEPHLVKALPTGVEIHAWKFYPGCGWGQLPYIR